MLTRTNIYLEPEIIRILRQRAENEGLSMAEVIRRILLERLNKEPNNIKGLFELVKHAEKTGIKDLASKHDKYLYE